MPCMWVFLMESVTALTATLSGNAKGAPVRPSGVNRIREPSAPTALPLGGVHCAFRLSVQGSFQGNAAAVRCSKKPGGGGRRRHGMQAWNAVRILTLMCLVAALGTPSHAAEQNLYAKRGGGLDCTFYGTIERSDRLKLELHAADGCTTLYLSSLGGDVEVALALGRIIRKAEMTVVVLRDKHCASACVFLYAGGVRRLPYSLIMIHRPYLAAGDRSFQSTQQQFLELRDQVLAFLREMNVSAELYERMSRVSPQDAEALGVKELEKLGLGINDPVYIEYIDNRKAAAAGMAKTDYLAKKALTTKVCGDIDGVIDEHDIDRVIGCWKLMFPEAMKPLAK